MPDHDIAVSVRGLSKSYTIAHNAPAHTTMGEAIAHTLKNPRRRAAEKETFWALRDVGFDIHKGDVVGIIGRNGAGKSTLLKVLSRITEPTTGQIDLFGRVGSLLEVGTGFHPELTGRENISMNGAILGMTKREIARQFDAIVEFAEVAQFLDTPVKRYSSGMYVRLAFSVAAHLNPEILIVDEVLAVGDAEFQKKCLGKMHQISEQEGRTVLFVSHQIAAVQKLCNKVVVMRQGQIAYHGAVDEGVAVYLEQTNPNNGSGTIDLQTVKRHVGTGVVKITQCRLVHDRLSKAAFGNIFQVGEKIGITVTLRAERPVTEVSVGFAVLDINGTVLFTSHHDDLLDVHDLPAGRSVCEAWIDPNYLQPGRYTLQLGVLVRAVTSDYITDVAEIDIASVLGSASSRLDSRPGVMRIDFPWRITAEESDEASVSQNTYWASEVSVG